MHSFRRFFVLACAVSLIGTLGCASPSRAFVAPAFERCVPADTAPDDLKVVSFNIRSGLSSSIDAVADALKDLDADVIAVQEVDVGVARTRREDQAELLATKLGMRHIFAGAIKREGGDYGVALLTRLPVTKADRIDLSASGAFEPRVAIDATVCHHGQQVRVIAVHTDVLPWAGAANARDLAKILKGAEGHVIVAGDLNATPKEGAIASLTGAGFKDLLSGLAEGPTFIGSDRRLDYVMANGPMEKLAKSARRVDVKVSDHIPVFVEFNAVVP